MDADPRQRPLGLQLLEADRPLGQRRRVRGHDHHRVADRLHDPRLVGQRVLHPLDEALDDVERLLLPRLLGQPRVAREVGERDRHAQAAEVELLLALGLEVPDDVLLDEVVEEALVQVIHDGGRERQQVTREALHLLGHLQAGDAVADQRLVDVEVEQPDLGVRDLLDRLPVDAHELEEGDEREARAEHRRDVAQQLQVVLGDVLELVLADADRLPHAREQRGLESGLLGRLLERVAAVAGREQVLHVAEREPPGARGLLERLERIAARAQPGHDPRVRDGGRGPAARRERDDRVGDPAAQRRRRDADLLRDVREGGLFAGHAPGKESGGTVSTAPPLAGETARFVGRRRSSVKATPCAGSRPTLPGRSVRRGLLLGVLRVNGPRG
jgi:hypothetical protein